MPTPHSPRCATGKQETASPPPNTPVADDDSAMLRAILDHGPSLVFAIDEGLRIRSINRVPAGLEVEDVLGTSCLDHVPHAFHATVREAVAQVLRTGEPARYETRARGLEVLARGRLAEQGLRRLVDRMAPQP